MKTIKLSLVIMAAALLTIGLGGMAYAFHAGGVADCAGCHSMHTPMGVHLLVASDASSTCLTCHESATDTGPNGFHVSTAQASLTTGTAPFQRGPGGDFAWLKKTYTTTSRSGVVSTEDGSTHGHNIIAADKGYAAGVANFSQAPGGSFLSSNLGCDSCHDPHGKGRRDSAGNYSTTGAPIIASGSTGTIPTAGQAVGLYRILAWPGYNTAGQNFTSWPIAVSPSSYNATEATNMVRIAYGGGSSVNGWGKWCGGCHLAIANMTGFGTHPSHPVDKPITAPFATNYNTYVKSGLMDGSFSQGGTPGPYTSLVPYQEATSDIATLQGHARSNNLVLGGPTATDEVTCYSCHRAHASGWINGLRWNNTTTFIVNNGVYPAEQGRTAPETQGAYYDRPPTVFASFQRSLCNKCHAKD
jgi:predicted CXXCH cytochrome family protein